MKCGQGLPNPGQKPECSSPVWLPELVLMVRTLRIFTSVTQEALEKAHPIQNSNKGDSPEVTSKPDVGNPNMGY